MDSAAAGRDAQARRRSSFGSVAAAYAEYRPDYPAAAVRWCVAPSGRPVESLRVLDLGAGTGKLTSLLITLGAQVTAVEPDAAMLAELRHGLPAARALPGSAERIPLPGGAVDAVLCGQSMHWFDMSRALPEIARVLAAGGTLAGLWNSDDDRVGWVAGWHEVAGTSAPPSLSGYRAAAATFSADQFNAARHGATQPGASQPGGAGPGWPWFGPAERAEFPNSKRLTADTLVALVATHSKVVIMEPGRRDQLLAGIRAYLTARPETAGEFDLPMVTSVIRAVRL